MYIVKTYNTKTLYYKKKLNQILMFRKLSFLSHFEIQSTYFEVYLLLR